ncbi:MAG: HD domain-containing protein [Chloroflexi bacterium]|nr:HD domain-containing protein [Chloroflexota bacterium]
MNVGLTPPSHVRIVPFRFWQRSIYRIRQFFQGLSAHISVADRQAVTEILPDAAVALFARMPLDAQRHSLNVMYTLQTAGYDQPDLLVAALLHDVGKVAADDAGVRLGLWLRGPLVLLDAIAPAWLDAWAVADPEQQWRYALYVHRQHPQIGARWASATGCTPDACWLIAQHQASGYQANDPRCALLLALQAADGHN